MIFSLYMYVGTKQLLVAQKQVAPPVTFTQLVLVWLKGPQAYVGYDPAGSEIHCEKSRLRKQLGSYLQTFVLLHTNVPLVQLVIGNEVTPGPATPW